jgi:hypothetical protein
MTMTVSVGIAEGATEPETYPGPAVGAYLTAWSPEPHLSEQSRAGGQVYLLDAAQPAGAALMHLAEEARRPERWTEPVAVVGSNTRYGSFGLSAVIAPRGSAI